MNWRTFGDSFQELRPKPVGVMSYKASGGAMAFILGVGAILYVLLASGCAAFLLWKAYWAPRGTLPTPPDDFDKLAIAALIAVIGTCLTGLASIYGATRQSATAYQVAEYNGVISSHLAGAKASSDAALAEMQARLDASLATVRAASEESLARLKVALDAGQVAHRELYGSATVYFHALRASALSKWNDESLEAAETSMVAATRHLLHVGHEMRDEWFDFWQRAQDIRRETLAELDSSKRPALVASLIDKKTGVKSGSLDLRELHHRLECTAQKRQAYSSIAQPT